MKGQTDLLIFILLFIISLFLFTSASIWSNTIFQQNVDVANVQSAEKFIKELDTGILNLVKYGGYQELRYNIEGPINVSSNNISILVPVTIQLSNSWVNLTSDGSYIRERLEGKIFKIQAVYPQKDYRIEFFTDGSSLAEPEYVIIERNLTYVDSGMTVIRIKITFA